MDQGASTAVVRTRLVNFNLSIRSVWCARLQLLTKYVCQDVLGDPPHLLPFQATIAHRVAEPFSYRAPTLFSEPVP